MRDYRVVEYNGEFRIEVKKKTEVITGFLWWKKTTLKEHWCNSDLHGNPVSRVTVYSNALPTYDNIDDALKMIDIIFVGEKYTYAGQSQMPRI